MSLFQSEYAKVLAGVSDHRVTSRHWRAAQALLDKYPNEPKAHYVYNLACCRTGRDNGAERLNGRMNQANQQCQGKPDLRLVLGDMSRDALEAILDNPGRYRGSSTFYRLEEIRDFHQGDPNRLAYANSLEGRVEYARGHYAAACDLHSRADQALTDPAWRHSNLVHWLEAACAFPERDRDLEFEQLLRHRISSARPRSRR